ncbi:MAG: hypothetical protein Q9O62_09260 [Ardenticatenia bacterium]|nr:hypothetical protein [Ardenticatenia bacterium]
MMGRSRIVLYALPLVIVLLTFSAAVAGGLAQTGSGYDLTWWTVDGGGGTVNGGGYALMGTAGQPDAAVALTGGDFTLYGGFWSGGGGVSGYAIYLPLVLRNR